MSDEANLGSVSAQTGSLEGLSADPSKNGESNGKTDAGDVVPRQQYEDLEKKLGEQGEEVGKLRGFFNEISPLLDKLNGQDELVDAILNDKFDPKTVQAILKGELNAQDASAVTKAHEEVKKDLGVKKYDRLAPDEVEKLVEERLTVRLSELKSDIRKDLVDHEEKQDFESNVEKFISSTSDFSDYSDKISQWLDAHPDVYDIETAYLAVKGKALIEESNKKNQELLGENAKNLAGNAGGGSSQGGTLPEEKNIADSLIGKLSNPNIF
jgi:hypothetical protein